MTDMSKKTEALKLAEDALKRVRTQDMELVQMSMIALAALREALTSVPDWASEAKEQPAPATELREQEPKKDLMYSTVAMQERHAAFVDKAVATLEQAKREALAEQPAHEQPFDHKAAANAALRDAQNRSYQVAKSTQPAQQEPPTVAELVCVCGAEWEWRNRDWELVATPPAQRTWVNATTWRGLTDEEIAQGCKESWVTEQAWQSAVWWAEAKLKEKNA